mgnify:CR=1 FL=1
MPRPLPTEDEAREILARRKTRPLPRPAPRVGRALEKLIRTLDDRYGRGAEALEARWPEIVGERLAAVTRPQKLTRPRKGADSKSAGATLELRVAGPAALLVQHQSGDILERVNLFLGQGAVERLRIAQGPIGPRATRSRPPLTKPAAPPPLGAADEAALRASVAAAPAPLAAALERLGRSVLNRRTGRP